MPDPNRESVSASQVAALFNVSPWQTRWMLWQQFANGVVMDEPETSRMKWGKLIEPLVLDEAAREWKLEIRPNTCRNDGERPYRQKYYRRGLVGATRDATIIAPGKGPGAVEVKCVFDYPTWMSEWGGGRNVPRHVEIQLQTQMMVGDGDGSRPFEWGLIAVWVCAGTELYYYEREPIIHLWKRIEGEALAFFRSVERREEPEPFGDPVELPWLTSMFAHTKGLSLDLSSQWEHVKTAEDLRLYAEFMETRSGAARVLEELRSKFLALAKDCGEVILPCGFRYRVQRHGKGKAIVPLVPEVPSDPPPPPEPALV